MSLVTSSDMLTKFKKSQLFEDPTVSYTNTPLLAIVLGPGNPLKRYALTRALSVLNASKHAPGDYFEASFVLRLSGRL